MLVVGGLAVDPTRARNHEGIDVQHLVTNEEVIQTYTVAVQNKYDLFGHTI